MDIGVKAQRQAENVVEIIRHDREPAAMREPVGVEADENRAADREQAEGGPGGHERQQIAPCQSCAGRLRARHAVDDAPKEHRLGEGRDGERQIGARPV